MCFLFAVLSNVLVREFCIMRRRVSRAFVAAMFAAGSAFAAQAGDLTFQFHNPDFGGNPGNGPFLLALANTQKTATASDAKTSTTSSSSLTGTSSPTGSSQADLFIQQLQGRLLSALSAQVTDAIFGTNPQNSGTIKFGSTTITFNRTPSAIKLNIIDVVNGTNTTISVPQLITSTSGG